MSTKIPLYNCYWCRCGWCILRNECIDHCIKCLQQKKFKMSLYCENFIEDSESNRRIQARNHECDICKYKKTLEELQEDLQKLLIDYTK
jgi:hypothetical protein